MRAENLSVAAAFELSYRDLTASQQRLFGRLGLAPGRTSTRTRPPPSMRPARKPPAAGWTSSTTIIWSPSPCPAGTSCTTCSASTPARSPPPRTRPIPAAAAGRLMSCYAHVAATASQHIGTWTTAGGRPPPGDPPASAPQLATAAEAAAWLEAERPNLHAAVGFTARPCPRTPSRSPRRWAASCAPAATGTRPPPSTRPPSAPRAAPGTGPARPGRSTSSACCSS